MSEENVVGDVGWFKEEKVVGSVKPRQIWFCLGETDVVF